jgi:GNAT superfamily N-acetyltransferase
MSKAGFLSGHGHLFSEEEQALIRASTSSEIYRFTWSPLPPKPILALAVDGPRIVGAISVHRHDVPGEYSVIEPMNVLPDYQRHGVGRDLWTFMAAHCKQFGDKGFQVWALDNSTMAANFYKYKIGCSVIGKGTWWLRDHMEPATGFQYDF